MIFFHKFHDFSRCGKCFCNFLVLCCCFFFMTVETPTAFFHKNPCIYYSGEKKKPVRISHSECSCFQNMHCQSPCLSTIICLHMNIHYSSQVSHTLQYFARKGVGLKHHNQKHKIDWNKCLGLHYHDMCRVYETTITCHLKSQIAWKMY